MRKECMLRYKYKTYHRIHLLLSHCPVLYPHTLSVLGQPQKWPSQDVKGIIATITHYKCDRISLNLFSKYSVWSISKDIRWTEGGTVFLAFLRSLEYIFCSKVGTWWNTVLCLFYFILLIDKWLIKSSFLDSIEELNVGSIPQFKPKLAMEKPALK